VRHGLRPEGDADGAANNVLAQARDSEALISEHIGISKAE
jgi:hypothetical protein